MQEIQRNLDGTPMLNPDGTPVIAEQPRMNLEPRIVAGVPDTQIESVNLDGSVIPVEPDYGNWTDNKIRDYIVRQGYNLRSDEVINGYTVAFRNEAFGFGMTPEDLEAARGNKLTD